MKIRYFLLGIAVLTLAIWLMPNASAQFASNEDSSGNARHLTCQNLVDSTGSEAKYGDGFDYDPTTAADWCRTVNSTAFWFADMSIFAAAFVDVDAGFETIAANGGCNAAVNNPDTSWCLVVRGDSATHHTYFLVDSNGEDCGTASYADGYHTIGAIRDTTANTIKMYVDGVLDGPGCTPLNDPPTPAKAVRTWLGCATISNILPNTCSGAREFGGEIYEVRLWDFEIAEADMLALGDSSNNAFTMSPVGGEYATYFLEAFDPGVPPGGGVWIESDLEIDPGLVTGAHLDGLRVSYDSTPFLWISSSGPAAANNRIHKYSSAIAELEEKVACDLDGLGEQQIVELDLTEDGFPLTDCVTDGGNTAIAAYTDTGGILSYVAFENFGQSDAFLMESTTANRVVSLSESTTALEEIDIPERRILAQSPTLGDVLAADIDNDPDNNVTWIAYTGAGGTFVKSQIGGTLVASSATDHFAIQIFNRTIYAAQDAGGNNIQIAKYTINPGAGFTQTAIGNVTPFDNGYDSMRISKDGRYLVFWENDLVHLYDTSDMSQIGAMNVSNAILPGSIGGVDIDWGNNFVYAITGFGATTDTIYRFPIAAFTVSECGNGNPNPTNCANSFDNSQTTGEFFVPSTPDLGEGGNPLDAIATNIADSWGISLAATGALLTVALLGFMFYWFAKISDSPVVLGVVGFIGVTASFFLKLIPLFVLFIVGFLILAFVTLVFFSPRGSDSE